MGKLLSPVKCIHNLIDLSLQVMYVIVVDKKVRLYSIDNFSSININFLIQVIGYTTVLQIMTESMITALG